LSRVSASFFFKKKKKKKKKKKQKTEKPLLLPLLLDMTANLQRAKANYDRYLQFNVGVGYKLSENPSVWVKDEKEGYLKGEIQSKDGGKLKVKFGDGSSVVVNEKDTEPANPSKFDGVKDCSDLSHLNNATVLHNLRVRYAEDLIHTYSGLFLVVVNPYKWIPIYTDEIIQLYQGKRRNEVHPHVFAVADEAYRAMVNGKRNQSILITGESGAGKTENTKKVIQYLATIAGKATQGGKLEEQILQANPMLEAFGNAKTNKNDNSSRFGKFIRIQFNSGGIICGTTIQVYLLEKSRVVFQGKGERTFHIFYQLLAGADSVQRKKYFLQKATDYGFFTDQNAIVLKSMDDGAEWGHTLKAMEVIGLTNEEQDSIFRMVSGVMQCGNIKYGSSYGGEGAKIENGEVLDKIAELWAVNREQFEKALIKPRVQAGREIVEKHLNKTEASYAREALCKSLYERAFLWIVKKLNRVLASPTEANFIGVLDIAGFEIFENNSFEQLCINYTNEKLQQFFNNHMFKLEQEEYEREKITWTYIDFGLDSIQTIDLIDKKDNSIIALLDEETIFPRATDESLIQKLHTLAKKHTKYSEVQFKKLNFQIQHYAGDVNYNVTDWITKNKDPLQDDIAKSIQSSKNAFFASLFSDPDLDPRERLAQQKAAAAEAAGKKKAVTTSGATFLTVASAYKDQLADLMDTLRATEPNFIRCLIPNLQKKQQSLNAELILEQLACNGVLEGIRISRKGYPNRLK
jgi:myosin protein heavy chain